LWALDWAWQTFFSIYGKVSGRMIFAFFALELAGQRTDGQTDRARSTRLLILIKNIYMVENASFYLFHTFRRI